MFHNGEIISFKNKKRERRRMGGGSGDKKSVVCQCCGLLTHFSIEFMGIFLFFYLRLSSAPLVIS